MTQLQKQSLYNLHTDDTAPKCYFRSQAEDNEEGKTTFGVIKKPKGTVRLHENNGKNRCVTEIIC